MLTKRKNGQASRTKLQGLMGSAASAPMDRRTFLRRSGLAVGGLAAAGEEQDFFERHVEPWAGRFFADLEKAKAAKFYRSVGTLGRLFIDIEIEAFAMETRRSA